MPVESPVDDTLDQATPLTLGPSGTAVVQAAVGDSPAGAADVDFYALTLATASHVTLGVSGDGGSASLKSILTLYGADPTAALRYRVVTQDDGSTHGGDATLDRDLGAGTWYVAVSGAGNRWFNPFLAGSGYDGDTGPYTLNASATSLGLTASDGPALLLADPASGAVVSNSPLALRLGFSRAIDNGTFVAGSTVRLTYNADGSFGGVGDVPVALASIKRISGTNELVLTPAAPLRAGFYQVFLAGDHQAHSSVLTSSGKPLGKDANHAFGQDVVFTFQVDGVEGSTAAGAGADDTVDTAHNLGDVTSVGFVHVTGTIGDDPTDPVPYNRSDVDLYRFTVSGSSDYAFGAEVFAGRIGSPLDAALTLFRLDPGVSTPVFIASNNSTLNDVQATNGSNPLASDPVLFTGLTEGEYLLAVSSSANFPDSLTPPGTSGVFDPLVPHSGTAGQSRGAYVLNLLVQPAPGRPNVVSASLSEGATLDGPPTTITVRFDRPVNLAQLSFEAYQLTAQGAMPAVFVVGSDGNSYFPRLQSYDPATNQATFLFLAPVPAGAAEFHLAGSPASGGPGLTGLGGAPLVGNQPGGSEGDYVVHFTVGGAERGSPGSPATWIAQEPNDTLETAQVLGPLFPLELASGVTVQRGLGAATADTADYFQFEVLQSQSYLVGLTNTTGLAPNALPEILDATGNSVAAQDQGNGTVSVTLTPGTYFLRVQGWSGSDAANVSYTATLTLPGSPEQPTPLTTGPAPALRILPVTTGSVTGVVFLDYNADGVRGPGEPGLAGRTVYLDLNGNGRLDAGEPLATTDADGSYAFSNLAVGTYTLREDHPYPGVLDAGPFGGARTVTVTGDVTGIDFGNLSFNPTSPVHLNADLYGPHPNADANTAFVQGLYRTVLGRDGESAGVSFWMNALATGMTREQVAWGFVNSTEHRFQQVDAYYRIFLGRPATDDLAAADWVSLLQASGDEAKVLKGILTSAEYTGLHTADADFVGDLYFRLLGRTGDADGMAYWEQRLGNGVSRAEVVDGILHSREAAELTEETYYAAYLHRAGDPQREYWIDALTSRSLTYGQMAAGFLSAAEFFQRAGENVP